MAYDNNQASVLVVSHLEYIRTQQFEYLKRLRAHFLHIDLALFVKLPLTSLIDPGTQPNPAPAVVRSLFTVNE